MSKPMEKALENLEKILEKTRDESHQTRLEEVTKLVSTNSKKIWLRTKTGKPFAENTFKITEKIVSQFESEITEAALTKLEEQVTLIHEESGRRSMVVT